VGYTQCRITAHDGRSWNEDQVKIADRLAYSYWIRAKRRCFGIIDAQVHARAEKKLIAMPESPLTSQTPHFNIVSQDVWRRTAAANNFCEKGFRSMSDNLVSGVSAADSLKSVADALETAVQAAKDGAADARSTVEKAIPAASRFLSRFVYTTTYTFSYGVVFPAVLIARSIPSDNAVVHGFVDGARAACDSVDKWKSSRVGSHVDHVPSLHS
jgi:hypothetical protein